MKKLLENFNELKELPFPGSCESDALADWITNLAEIDGYYVGKVISSLNGGKREFINCEYLELLRKQLEDITELPEEDEEIFQACENYLEALASIAL